MAWAKTNPAAGIAAKQLDNDIRTNNDALEAAIDNEHDFTTGGTQSGIHTQGSARCFFRATQPLTRISGDAFTSADLGSLWVDSDNNVVYVLTATTPTWTPVSTEIIATLLAAGRIFGSTLGVTGNFAVNTNKFTVTASSGNTLVAGTLDVAGNIDPTTFETTRGGFKDEDDMASNSATAVASQQSIKAYVDAQVSTKVFGSYASGSLMGITWNTPITNSTSNANEIPATQATTDGFLMVTAEATSNNTSGKCDIYTDSSNPPTTKRASVHAHGSNDTVQLSTSACVPVKKGEYFKVSYTDAGGNNVTRTYNWIPLGN